MGDPLKSEKWNSDGQGDIGYGKIGTEDRVNISDGEAEIFKNKKYTDICNYGERNEKSGQIFIAAEFVDCQTEKPIKYDWAEHYQNINRLAPCIEKKAW